MCLELLHTCLLVPCKFMTSLPRWLYCLRSHFIHRKRQKMTERIRQQVLSCSHEDEACMCYTANHVCRHMWRACQQMFRAIRDSWVVCCTLVLAWRMKRSACCMKLYLSLHSRSDLDYIIKGMIAMTSQCIAALCWPGLCFAL